jgi:hypothetical protein
LAALPATSALSALFSALSMLVDMMLPRSERCRFLCRTLDQG